MKDTALKLGFLIVAILFVFVLYRNGERENREEENGRYQIISARLPSGAGDVYETVVRIDGRTGKAEYYWDTSTIGKINCGWIELRDQKKIITP